MPMNGIRTNSSVKYLNININGLETLVYVRAAEVDILNSEYEKPIREHLLLTHELLNETLFFKMYAM